MEYVQGNFGRVFVARLHDGESIYQTVEEIAQKENIRSASVIAVGGMRSGKVVTGPENVTGEVIPIYQEFDDAREIVGVGTIFPKNGKPFLHFHAAIGRGDEAIVGCPRAGMSVYLVLEVIIMEMVGIDIERVFDPESGLYLLSIPGAEQE